MIAALLSLTDGLSPLSAFGCLKLFSLLCCVYYICTKIRTTAQIGKLLPALNIGINYSPVQTFSHLSNALFGVVLNNNENEQAGKAKKYEAKSVCPGNGAENMLQVWPHAKKQPFAFNIDWGIYFPHLAQALRSKKYNYPQVSHAVAKDAELQRAIKQSAEQIMREQRIQQRLETARSTKSLQLLLTDNNNESTTNDTEQEHENFEAILKQQEKRARNLLRNMSSTLNNFLLGLTSWLLYKLLPCFISGVVTHTAHIEMLREAEARFPGTPLIFLPLHRSHLDYIMCTFILTNYDIRSPIVAAGDNLQIPVFGSLLRGLGAFYIKRKIDPVAGKKDILYRAVLQLYLQHALRMGHNVEFFIEGGRTRTGKPCLPKGGILSVIVNAYMDHSIPDALLVPVSINYERLVDGNFVREQKGEKKEPESFFKAVSSIWRAINSKYGLMRIDFNKPYSIRELVHSYNQLGHEDIKIQKPSNRQLKHNQSTSSLYGTDVVCEEHRNLIESISRQVVYDCAAATSVMSTNALAFLLLTRYRRGATDQTLAKALTHLRETLQGKRDMGFAGESIDIINYASDILRSNIVERTVRSEDSVWIKPVDSIDSLIELSYYSNMLTPHFALQSILLRTIYKFWHMSGNVHAHEARISRKQLIDNALENCIMYRYEFILNKPTETLEDVLLLALEDLISYQHITVHNKNVETKRSELTHQIARSVAYAMHDSDDDEARERVVNEGPMLSLCQEVDILEQQLGLCAVVAPFSHTYLAVAQSLYMLYKNPMLESDFVKFVIKDLTTKVQNGTYPYAESISTDSVRNCVKLLEKWSVVEICNHEGLRLLSLASLYDLSRESLKTIIHRIDACVLKMPQQLHNQSTVATTSIIF